MQLSRALEIFGTSPTYCSSQVTQMENLRKQSTVWGGTAEEMQMVFVMDLAGGLRGICVCYYCHSIMAVCQWGAIDA